MALLARITSGEPPPRVTEARPEVPAELADVIARLMEPDPTARLSDPTAAAAELEGFASD